MTARRHAHRDLRASDRAFDELVPRELRHLSQVHWTPVEVALRATALLAPTRGMRILDVGAGIGKLCSIGALSSTAIWCGVEQHELLVTAARALARALGVANRTWFVHGDAFALDWATFDAIYLYNPFELTVFESRDTPTPQIGAPARTQDRLATLRPGTRVVTLCGFGGAMPASYELLHHERIVAGAHLELTLWRQREPSAEVPRGR